MLWKWTKHIFPYWPLSRLLHTVDVLNKKNWSIGDKNVSILFLVHLSEIRKENNPSLLRHGFLNSPVFFLHGNLLRCPQYKHNYKLISLKLTTETHFQIISLISKLLSYDVRFLDFFVLSPSLVFFKKAISAGYLLM